MATTTAIIKKKKTQYPLRSKDTTEAHPYRVDNENIDRPRLLALQLKYTAINILDAGAVIQQNLPTSLYLYYLYLYYL
jgi:hypothetical protein